MLITREMLIRKVAEKSGYYQKNVRDVFNCLNDVIPECFGEVTDDEEIIIQLFQGLKIGCYVVPARQRKNPRTQEDIVCEPTVKPTAKFSDDFKKIIQSQYDENKEG